MVLVDFSLAFNCVKHTKLQQKLTTEFGFDQSAVQLIKSFLQDRSQVVKLGEDISTERTLVDGTPQGSCISALLFSLFINSLPSTLKCEYHMYADDLQIYLSGPIEEVDMLVRMINNDLDSIERWAADNNLFPNPKKTQAIIFCRTGQVIPRVSIRFCGEIITTSDRVVNLGLLMDRNLKWTEQINETTMKAYNILRTFRKFTLVLSTQIRLKLVQAVLMPLFTYCDIIYYPGLTMELKDRLHRCFKSSVRFIFKMNRFDSTANVRNVVLGHDLPNNYRLRICYFFRQAWDKKLPQYIMQHLPRGQMERSRTFRIPVHTSSKKKSLLIYGIPLWNGLSSEIKMKPSLETFKRALKCIQL